MLAVASGLALAVVPPTEADGEARRFGGSPHPDRQVVSRLSMSMAWGLVRIAIDTHVNSRKTLHFEGVARAHTYLRET